MLFGILKFYVSFSLAITRTFDPLQTYYIETSDLNFKRLTCINGIFYFLLPRIIEENDYPDTCFLREDIVHANGETNYEIIYDNQYKMRGKSIKNNVGDLVKMTDWYLDGEGNDFKIMSGNFCGTVGPFSEKVEGYQFIVTECKKEDDNVFVIRRSSTKRKHNKGTKIVFSKNGNANLNFKKKLEFEESD